MNISEFGTKRWPVIAPTDSPDMVYAAVRDLWRYKRLSTANARLIGEELERMERHFDIDQAGYLTHDVDPLMPGLTLCIELEDLEFALVALGCYTLDHRPEQSNEILPQVDSLLVAIDSLR